MQRITSSRRGVTGMMVSKGFACTKMIVWFRLVKNYRIIQQFSQNSDLVVNPGYVVAMFFWGMIKGSDRGILNDIWYNQQNYSTYFHDSTNCWLITNSWVIFISPAKLVILSTGLSLRCHGEMYWIYGSGDGLNSPWLLNDFNVAWLRKMAQSEMIYGWYIYMPIRNAKMPHPSWRKYTSILVPDKGPSDNQHGHGTTWGHRCFVILVSHSFEHGGF